MARYVSSRFADIGAGEVPFAFEVRLREVYAKLQADALAGDAGAKRSLEKRGLSWWRAGVGTIVQADPEFAPSQRLASE